MARIKRKSVLSGKIRTLEVDYFSQEEFDSRWKKMKEENLNMSEVFPELSGDALDFIAYGVTKEEKEKPDAFYR